MAYFLGQIPRLGVYLGRLPGVGGAISVVLERCRRRHSALAGGLRAATRSTTWCVYVWSASHRLFIVLLPALTG